MTIVLFIAVLFILILVHELGHFLTAKWSKMRVDEFAIGFPPRLFSLKKNETEYSINLLPIGGYVKIMGENGDVEGNKSQAFGSRPRYQQVIVLLAGVFMNILTAFVIFFAVAMIGTPTVVDEAMLNDRSDAKLLVTTILPESPAAEAKIPHGATITGVSNDESSLGNLTPAGFTDFIALSGDQTISITYTHKGDEETVSVTPTTGIIESEPDRRAVGVATAMVTNVKEGPIDALITASTRTYDTLIAITVGLASFIGSAFTLSADVSQVTGPIGIAGMVGDAAEFGFVSLLIFTAFISLNLAVINLLPIPALDGGRLLFVIAEAVIGRPIDPEWMGRVNLVGFALLILLMVAVTYNDILRLI